MPAFSFASSLTVTSPNGGESWQAGTTHNITWTSSGVPGTIQIQPYLNGVAQANLAASAPNTGSLSWSIPANYTPGSTYKIALSAMSGTVSDFSDANFSITAPATLTVTSPNGGESWQAGTTHNITWNSSGVTGTIQIQPYLNGVAQANIAAAAPNTGSYSWSIPSGYPLGSTYKISLSAMSGTVSDFSDANFSVTPQCEKVDTIPYEETFSSLGGFVLETNNNHQGALRVDGESHLIISDWAARKLRPVGVVNGPCGALRMLGW